MRRPLARCARFVQVWSNHPEAAGPAGGVTDTCVLGGERGLTFWRAQAPTGYARLGDCVTTGTMQPTFQARLPCPCRVLGSRVSTLQIL